MVENDYQVQVFGSLAKKKINTQVISITGCISIATVLIFYGTLLYKQLSYFWWNFTSNLYLILLNVSHFCHQKREFDVILMYVYHIYDCMWLYFFLLAIWKAPIVKHIIHILCIKLHQILFSDDKSDKMLKFAFWYVQSVFEIFR